MFDVEELQEEIRRIDPHNRLRAVAMSKALIPWLNTQVAEVQQNSEFNFKVLEIVFNYLLENDMVEDRDIETQMRAEDECADVTAKTFINVFERLRNK